MSWDIVLFNSSEKITSPESIDESKLIPVDFYGIFEKQFKNIVNLDNHCTINGFDFSIEYFYDGQYTSNMLLQLYGESSIYLIIDLANKNNWQIFDTGIGEMIDLNNPAKNGYKNFQSYLAEVLNKN